MPWALLSVLFLLIVVTLICKLYFSAPANLKPLSVGSPCKWDLKW